MRKILWKIKRFFTRRYKTKKALRHIGMIVTVEYNKNKSFRRKLEKAGLAKKIEAIMMKSLK